MNRARSRRRTIWFPVVFSLIIQLPGLIIAISNILTLAIVALSVAYASTFLLLVARRWPGPVLVAVAALCTVGIGVSVGPPFAAVPVAFAVVIAVLRGARVWAWPTLAGLGVVALFGWWLAHSPGFTFRLLASVVVLSLLIGITEGVRNRRDRMREISRQIAARRQTAAEAERLRIARELHDVLAHSLSQISVQSGVALHLFDAQPEQAREALASIKETSGSALEEVRSVLGVLRADEGVSRSPEPDLGRLPELIESSAINGLDVSIRNDLPDGLPASVQLAIFRIVQESLTNIGRHSHALKADVFLRVERDWLLITVTDSGPTKQPAATVHGSGRGVLGMRERAELLGGTLDAHSEGQGYRVVARFPKPVDHSATKESMS
jgi:signal transduction histidine kinase